jgi:dTDP-4-amino-4,6-dideoxygalactose transaminase
MKTISRKSDLAINGGPPLFVDPIHVGRPNVGDREAFLVRVNEIFDRRWFSNNGPMVVEFERRIADHVRVKHCVSMCNATIALEIATRALGLGGEVIVPSYTFIATAHCLSWQGIQPVFADIDPRTHNLDPAAVERMITPRTTGIIGVHLWGRPGPVEELQAIADRNNLSLMFDAAHAFHCSHRGRKVGGFGRCEILSFHATKFFNTFEGGAILTNDDALAEKCRLMRNFGFLGYDNVIHHGTNGKMVEVCAAMGLGSLESLESVVRTNRINYLAYRDAFRAIPGLHLLPYDSAEDCNYQYIVVEVDPTFPVTRDELVRIFHAENILVRKYFWPGCHAMKPYRELYPHSRLLLEKTELVANRVLVLPTGTAVDLAVIKSIGEIFQVVSSRHS